MPRAPHRRSLLGGRLLVAAPLCVLAVGCARPGPTPPAARPTPESSPAVSAPSARPAPDASAVEAGLQATYATVGAWEADFVQTYSMPAFGERKRSRGRVLFESPDKLRWEWAEPAGNLVVSDGVCLSSFVASDLQARRTPVAASSLPSALSFLASRGNLSRDHACALVANQTSSDGPALRCVPKAPSALYAAMTIVVDGASFQVRRVELVDAQGNVNQLDFSRARVRAAYPAGRFQWTPPAGVRVIATPPC